MKRDLRSRLRAAHARAQASVPAPGSGLRDALWRREERRRERDRVELPAGDVVANERGTCYVRRLRYPLDLRHGSRDLGAARGVDWEALAALAKLPDASRLELARCLFLDTETTGLSGGAGTLVFLVGLGFFADREFVLEQTFLQRIGDEAAALQHTAERLRERPYLVTFVGKSFDRHRLAARMAVAKVRSGVLTSRHLDLYHMARRRWKGELPDVRLQTVERWKLGVTRADDLPGAEAPAAFLDWIRDGTGPVDRVFEHNRLDVLTLVALLAEPGARPGAAAGHGAEVAP